MTRDLLIYPTKNTFDLMRCLRSALAGDGPAIFPHANTPTPRIVGHVPSHIAMVVGTSGSTTTPKQVMLSAEAVRANATASLAAVNSPRGQWFLALPAHYIAGIQVLIRSLVAETEPVVYPEKPFDPDIFARLAHTMTGEQRLISLVPTQLSRIVERADNAAILSAAQSFDAILVGGQSTDSALYTRARHLGLRVHLTYGASETCGGCVYDGIPIGDTVVRIVEEQIEVSGAILAEGYLNDPEQTAQSFVTEHGTRWYRTHDRGEIGEDGRLIVHGRTDNIIISGGVKISLDALERVVRTVNGFADAVVVAGTHPEWGKTPVVVHSTPVNTINSPLAPQATQILQTTQTPLAPQTSRVLNSPDVTLALESIRNTVADVMGRQAAPTRLVWVSEMPILASGKPDRRALYRIVNQ